MFTVLANVAIKSVAVLGAAWLVTLAMRGRSAAARHLVWIATAAALLALPLLTVLLPRVEMPGTAALVSAPLLSTTVTASPAIDPAVPTAAPTSQSTPKSAAVSTINWRMWILFVWAAGALLGLVRMIAGSFALWRARGIASASPDRTLGLELARSLGITRRVDILESQPGSMPMTFGILRPAVFMPKDAADWTEERRRVVLLHELAHVSRGDVAAHMFARLTFTLYWWNPLVWTAWREFLKERERATDDLVLSAGTRASDYAGHLLEIARTACSSRSMGWAAGWAAIAMARRSQLEGRLVSILDERVNRGSAKRAGAWVAVAIAIAMVAPLAALRAQDPQSATIPPDVDAFIRSANAQKNHKMLEDAAKAEESVQKYDIARKLMDTSLQVREEVSGGRSVEYGVGLIKIADLERRRGHIDDAVDFYSRAAAVLGNHPEAERALVYLGITALRNKDLALANDYFERAKTLSPEKSEATMWEAVTQERLGNLQEADALYRQALNQTSNAQGVSFRGPVTIARVYAQFLDRQGRTDDAKTVRERASALSRLQFEADRAKLASRKPDVYRIGGGVSAPVPLSKPEPKYSEEARLAKLQGSVALAVDIGIDGLAHNITVVNGLGLGLDDNAIAAVSRWTFKPGLKDGQPVTVQATIEVNFRLQ